MNTNKLPFGPMEVRQPVMVDEQIIARIPSKREAIRVCVRLSGRTEGAIADDLGIDRGHFSRIMSNKAHFPDDKYQDLYLVCGNYAPLQWECRQLGFSLVKETAREKEIRELESQLEALRMGA